MTLSLSAVCLAMWGGSRVARAAVCTDHAYSETFSSASTNEASKSTVINWRGGGPVFPTHKQGAFTSASGNPDRDTFPEQLIAADANAMYLMGGRRNALVALSTAQGCQLLAYGFTDSASFSVAPNLDESSRLVIDGSAACGPGALVITGDVAGDANLDIVTILPANVTTAGSIASASLYVRKASSTAFTKIDITAPLQAAGISIHSGTPAALGDVDGDGAADLIIASSRGNASQIIIFYANDRNGTPGFSAGVVAINDMGLLTPIADVGSPYTFGNGCQGVDDIVSRGATALAFGDLDGDLVPDILTASESEYSVRVYRGTGQGQFQVMPKISSFAGSMRLFLQDMDGDGDPDIVGVRSGRGCEGGWGSVWVSFNDGLSSFTTNPSGNPGPTLVLTDHDLDWAGLFSMPLTFADGVQPSGGAPSLILGKATGTSSYGTFYNTPSTSLYNISALALTQPITSSGGASSTLVSLKVGSINTSLPSGGNIVLDVSPDNGLHWEALQPYELSGAQPHIFTHFGEQLRWRASLRSPPAALASDQLDYLPAAKTVSRLSQIAFTYTTSAPSNYTRSKPVAITLNIGGTPIDHVLEASFEFPGYIGHLNAQSLAAYAVGNQNTLQTLSPTTTWDAGQKLQATTGSARAIFTMVAQGNVTTANMTSFTGTKVPLTAGEFVSGSTSPSLQTVMNMDPNRGAQYVNLMRDAISNSAGYKLRDPGHSSPAAVLAPCDDATYLGNNYAGFAAAQANRAPTVLLGANDGMLHAFDAQTGSERWAYVPYNLLSKMKNQVQLLSNGNINYRHDTFVDGAITVTDIFANNQWRTVAVVGQGEGSSASGTNYYHALDVTNPSACQPLWEMTEGLVESIKLCNPDPCASYVCSQSCTYVACSAENQSSLAEMSVSASNRDDSGYVYGLLEAEHFDASVPSRTAPTTTFTVLGTAQSSKASSASASTFVQAVGATGSCAASSYPNVLGCASLSYRINVASTAAGSYVPAFSLWNANGNTQLSVAIDNNIVFSGLPTFASSSGGWQWARIPAQMLAAGEHVLQVYMREPAIAIDKVAVTRRPGGPGAGMSETSGYLCALNCDNTGCVQQCLTSPDSQEWPSCGLGNGEKCCPVNTTGYCLDVAGTCGQPTSRMGQTFSPPAIGRIRTSAGDTFVAFFGSGYNTFPASVNVGRSIYMVNALSGVPMASWNLPPVASSASNPNIETTMPGGVTLVDADNDGYVDRLYVGDLAGRLWKLNTHPSAALDASGRMQTPSIYARCVLFDAAQQGSSARAWAPIITKPAVIVHTGTTPNVYFGTGGDNLAPTSVSYAFYSVRDTDDMDSCRATAKVASALSANALEWQISEPAGSGRFWADPTVLDNATVYFSSYIGAPDSINPCVQSSTASHIYGMATKPFTDAAGVGHATGTSVWSNKSAFLTATGVVRTAASVRGQAAPAQVVRPVTVVSVAPKDLIFQQFTGELLRVSSPGVQGPTKRLRVVSIREIPRSF